MTVFRGKDWISKTRIRLQSLTAKVKQPRNYKEIISRLRRWGIEHRVTIAKGAGAVVILIGISAGGNQYSQYVKANTLDIYHVYADGKEIGIVSDPKIIDQAVQERHKEVQLESPDVHMVLNTPKITYTKEKLFKAQYDNESAAQSIKPLLKEQATGVKLIIDGKTIAVLKDKEQAEAVLEQFKEKYGNPVKQPGKVQVLSAEEVLAPVSDENKVVKSVEFTQDVKIIENAFIQEEDLAEPDGVISLLESMGEPPLTYIVEKGDCVSCIAQKFDVSSQTIRDMNPWIEDDFILIGDELIVKGFEPTLAVRTIEIAVDEEEIQYDTDYETDDTLRLGKTRTISSGKNGLKKVTYELTSINGKLIKEDLLDEEVLVEPVSAKVAKGTLRLKGEGTGKFAWPVAKARLTSGFGSRWGTTHKGIDLVSSNRNIMAADTGKVTFAGFKKSFGNLVILDHKNGYITYYAHLSKINVKAGDVLEKGEKLGVMGTTGHSTGVHLHFEVHHNDKIQNPLKYLNK